METNQAYVLPRAEAGVRHFMHSVYAWMSLGLLVTGLCSAYMASDPRMIINLVRNPLLFYGLLGGEFALVIFLSRWLETMEAATAKFAFLFYAALTGVTLSVVYLAYTRESIAATFLLTAGTFSIMSAYGYLTKADLTSLGNLCFMALIGIILASVVNIFLHSQALQWATTYIGVLVFTGLTAYDTQKIKGLYAPGLSGSAVETKSAISGALALYLDFINLFLNLLRLVGRRRD